MFCVWFVWWRRGGMHLLGHFLSLMSKIQDQIQPAGLLDVLDILTGHLLAAEGGETTIGGEGDQWKFKIPYFMTVILLQRMTRTTLNVKLRGNCYFWLFMHLLSLRPPSLRVVDRLLETEKSVETKFCTIFLVSRPATSNFLIACGLLMQLWFARWYNGKRL